MSRIAFALASSALVLAISGTVWAQSQDLDTQTFKPAVGAYDILQVQSPRISRTRSWSSFVGTDYAFRPFRYVEADGTVSPFIYDRTTLIVGGAWAPTRWLEVGAMVPTTAQQRFGVHARLDPQLNAMPTSGMGDVMFVPKVKLYDGGALALGLSAPVTFPTHKEGGFLGHNEMSVRPRALLEWQPLPWLRAAGNAGAVVRSHASFLEVDQANAFEYGAALETPVWVGDHQWAAMVSIAGEARELKAQLVETPAQLMAGMRWTLPNGLGVSVSGGPGLTHAAGTPQWRTFAAISFIAPDVESRRERALAALAMKMARENAAAPAEPPPVEDVDKVVVDEEAGKILILEKVYFAFDRDEILPRSYNVLAQVATTLLARPDIPHVLIEGHTDDAGTPDYNLDLSERRAQNVRAFLIHQGVDASRLTAVGYGETRPLTANVDDASRAKNRRVEFTIVSDHTSAAPSADPWDEAVTWSDDDWGTWEDDAAEAHEDDFLGDL